MLRSRLAPVAAALILSLVCVSLSVLALPGAVVAGQIKRPSGEPVAGVTVWLVEASGGRLSAVSDADGWYRLEAEPGVYSLECEPSPGNSSKPLRVSLGQLSQYSAVVRHLVIANTAESQLPSDSHLDLLNGSLLTRFNLDDLPTARDIWSLLENQERFTVVSRVDSAGVRIASMALFSGRGSSWVQNAFRLNGVDVSDPEAPGRPLLIPPYDALRAVQVVSAGHSAAEAGSGETVEILTTRAGDKTHGEARLYYQGSPTQWDAVSSRLSAQGSLGAPRVSRHWEGVAQLGGPLVGRTQYIASASIQDSSFRIPAFEPLVDRRLLSGTVRLDGEPGQGRAGLLVTGQEWDQNHADASFRTLPLSTLQEEDGFRVLQGYWAWEPTPRLGLDSRASFARARLNHLFQEPPTRQSGTVLFTGYRSGTAPSEIDSRRSRLTVQSGLSWYPAYGRFLQQLQAGLEIGRGRADNHVRVFEDIGLAFLPSDLGANPLVPAAAAPAFVRQYNTPSLSRYGVDTAALYLRHRTAVSSRLSIAAGLRIDSMSGSLLDQSNPGGTYSEARSLAARPDLIGWTNAAPRLSLASRPFGNGTVVRFSLGRYHHLLTGLLLESVNPMSLGGSIRRWMDRDADGQFQAGEQGEILKLFGAQFTELDHKLKRPKTDEILLGAEQDLPAGFVLRADLIRRQEKDRIETVNVGVPSSAYDPIQIHDPGGDWVAGTGDDQDLTVYNQKSDTLGQDSYLLTNPPGLSAKHEGLELTLSRTAPQFSFSLAFGAYRTFARTGPGNSELQNDQGVIGGLFDDPNAGIKSYGRVYFDRSFTAKLLTLYRGPRGLMISAVGRYYDGLPFARMLVVTGMNQGPFAIMATPRGNPGGHRTEYHRTVDLRIRKQFVASGRRLGLVLDVFNLLNDDKKTLEGEMSGPRFSVRIPLATQAPRVARVGVEYSF